jgi:hypothetical protein
MEDVLKVQVWGPLEQMYRRGWRVEILGMSNIVLHLHKSAKVIFRIYSYVFLITSLRM